MNQTNEKQQNDPKSKNQDQIKFDDFDKLNLKPFGENLFQIMEKGVNSSVGERGAYTISLNAEFGNGKTTFLKMFQHFIQDEKNEKYDVLFINAWESDFYKEPVIAILSEFVYWLRNSDKENSASARQTPDQKVLKVIGTITNQLIQYKTGINIKEAIDSYKNGESPDQDVTIGAVVSKNFQQRKTAIMDIKNAVSGYIKNKKLLIVVDELDRTRPDYAVRFLEDTKHFFDIKNVVFLIAVNRSQMEATVKCLYGKDLDFNGYYRKFFKQEVDLPDPYKEARKFVDGLLQKTNVKFQQGHREARTLCSYLSCKMFGLTLREIENFIRIFEHILGSTDQKTTWVYQDCFSFFICLFLKKKDIFQEILKENFTVSKFITFLDDNNFKFRINNVEEITTEVDQNNYLLGTIALSFMKDKESGADRELITEFCPRMSGLNFSGLGGIHRPIKNQPAVDICKQIDQCKSVFSE